MRNWHDLLPWHEALEQAAWERRQRVLRGRQAGAKLREIGSALGTSKETVRRLESWAVHRDRGRTSPVERYCQQVGELITLVGWVKREQKRHRIGQNWL